MQDGIYTQFRTSVPMTSVYVPDLTNNLYLQGGLYGRGLSFVDNKVRNSGVPTVNSRAARVSVAGRMFHKVVNKK